MEILPATAFSVASSRNWKGGIFFKKTMFDLKVINSVLQQLEEERGIPKEKALEAIEWALATAYKKEYGSRGQIGRASCRERV